MPNPKNDMFHSGEEYSKARDNLGPEYERSPKERPGRQSAGGRNYSKLQYAEWTTEELREAAQSIDLSGWKSAPREELIEALESSQRR